MKKYFQSTGAMVWFITAMVLSCLLYWSEGGESASAFMLGVGITWLGLAKDERS